MKKELQIIDLFSGVGGLSLGAARAGFKVAGSIELDKHASDSHQYNFPNTSHINDDILSYNGDSLLEKFDIEEVAGIIGGPPCQGFSNIGSGDVNDPRNKLFVYFFQLVSEIKPTFFVAENVPGILNPKYDLLRNEAFSKISDYEIMEPLAVSATDFGAPTIRKRIFFIGYKKEKRMSLKRTDFESQFMPNDKAIRIADAFSGLQDDLTKVDTTLKNTSCVSITKKKKEKYPYFFSRVEGNIPKGVGGKNLDIYNKKKVVSGFNKTTHTPSVAKRFSSLLPGEQDKISKCVKLNPKGFSPTLRAGTGSDKGSYQAVRPIHYNRGRVITPREAARIQGFPDWFEFDKTIWHSFRQIGNSVSPLVAEGILSCVYQKLTSLK